jgi:hypothetical protein
MNLPIGADRKKIYLLGGLVVVMLGVFYYNSSSSDSSPQPSRPGASGRGPLGIKAPQDPVIGGPPIQQVSTRVPNRRGTANLQEFHPSLKPKKPEERSDPMSVDPTIKLDVLKKLSLVNVESTHRSIFDFSQPPPPPAPKPDPNKKNTPVVSPLITSIPANQPAPSGPPPAPPPPPIPLKFYGYVSALMQGNKRAFFAEGDDIFIAMEGELVKKRYRIVRIGVNSVVVEDMQFKNQQTLPLEAQPAG